MTTTPFDSLGNPDVMGSRMLSDDQLDRVERIKLDINQMLARPPFARYPGMGDEEARLVAMARSHLEQAGILAVKAISREGE